MDVRRLGDGTPVGEIALGAMAFSNFYAGGDDEAGVAAIQRALDADITLIDPNLSWRVDANAFHSKSINSPFHGWTLQGRAVATIVGGRVKYRLG